MSQQQLLCAVCIRQDGNLIASSFCFLISHFYTLFLSLASVMAPLFLLHRVCIYSVIVHFDCSTKILTIPCSFNLSLCNELHQWHKTHSYRLLMLTPTKCESLKVQDGGVVKACGVHFKRPSKRPL